MVFVRGSAGKNADLYTAQWNGETWDEPRPIAALNTSFDELNPALSRDGQHLYFSSNRPGGLGGYDLWVARWQEGTWVEPVNLGPQLNSESDEIGPAVSPDGDRLYFSSNRPKLERSEMDKLIGKKSSAGRDYDIFAADLKPAATASRVDALNSASDDGPVALSPRGEFVYFSSNRPGGQGGFDIYRSRVLDGKLQPPENLGGSVNTSAHETDPAVWMEGYDLMFSSNRNSPDPQEFSLYQSVSREVIARSDYSALLAFLSLFKKLKWLVLLFTLALVALLYLLRNFMNEQWRVRTSLLQKCLLGSALVHVVIGFLLSLWVISSAIYASVQESFLAIPLDVNALATERLGLDIREQVTELFQQSGSTPSQQKVDQLPLPSGQPQPQEVTFESASTKIDMTASAEPTPVSEGRKADVLRPAEHAREIPRTQLASAPVQLETPQPIAPQTTKEFGAAPSAVDVRPVRTGDRPQAPLVGAVNTLASSSLADGSQKRLSQVGSAFYGALPVSESPYAATPGAATLTQPRVSGSLDLPTAQLAMEVGKPSNLQGSDGGGGGGPQINPLKENRSLAVAVADASLPASQPRAALPQIAGGSAGSPTGKGSGQHSALEADLPLSESVPTTGIKSPQSPGAKMAGSGIEIQAKLTMETGKSGGQPQAGAGSEVRPLQSGQSLAEFGDTQLPRGQPAKMTVNIGAGGSGSPTPQRMALAQTLPMAESAANTSGGVGGGGGSTPAKARSVAALGSLQLSAGVSLETNNAPALARGAGPQINPLHPGVSLVSVAAGIETLGSQQQPQKLAANLPTGLGTGTGWGLQRSALEGNAPVLESQTASRIMAEEKSMTNAVGSLNFQAGVNMEAGRPAEGGMGGQQLIATRTGGEESNTSKAGAQKLNSSQPGGQEPSPSEGGGQGLKPSPSEFHVGSLAPQFPALQGEPQKIEQQIAGSGKPGVFLPQSGTVRPMESTPNLIELHGPGEAPRMKIPALEMAASVTFSGETQPQSAYLLRDPKHRSRVLESLGGTWQTESAIARSLEWFTRHQEADGHWAIQKHGGLQGHDVAATSLALLCYMGWGAKHTEPGPHQEAMARGLDWLVKQVKHRGDMRGDSGTMYDHGMATIALAEAYGLTKDPALQLPLTKAIGFIQYAQNSDTGGWRYIPGAEGDTSVFGWQLMALKSASLAGLVIPPHVLEKASGWLERVASGEHGGLYGYQDKTPLPAMCAEGMFCQQLLGRPPTDPRMQETAAYLQTRLPSTEKERINYYYWYYGCLALYQHQGPVWEQWNEQIRTIFVKSQNREGDESGSWDSAGQWGHESGRAVTTALATLSLEVYYRYLPLYGLTTASR